MELTKETTFTFICEGKVREIKSGIYKIPNIKETFKLSEIKECRQFPDSDISFCSEITFTSETSRTKFKFKNIDYIKEAKTPAIAKSLKDSYSSHDHDLFALDCELANQGV